MFSPVCHGALWPFGHGPRLAFEPLFPKNASLDLEMQRTVLGQHYRYHALIPVPLGEDFSFMEDNEEQWSALESQHSICDIIMQDVPVRQVMEVHGSRIWCGECTSPE